MPRIAERALNPLIALELGAMLPDWHVTAESTRILTDPRRAPDIIVETGVSPISVETEHMPARTVEDDALSRIGTTVAATGQRIESAVALRVPAHLSRAHTEELESLLGRTSDFQWCAWIEGPLSVRFPSRGWLEGALTDLAGFLETVAVSERRVASLADAFELGVSQAATRLRTHLVRADGQATLDKIAAALHLQDSEQTSVIATAVLANALVFQSAVSAPLGTPTIEELRTPNGDITAADVLSTWRDILDVNYWPIFAVAANVLKPISESAAQPLLRQLAQTVANISSGGVLETGDLAGQMFGRLIADRKFLATFYTLPASAALLAELAVSRLDGRCEWSDPGAAARLKIADFACGTGMLLSATYRRIASRVRRTSRIKAVDQVRLMHSAFMEDVIIGCDIMPAAVHLTASILSAAYPSAPFGGTNIHLMPYGYHDGDTALGASIGSLELLGDERVMSLFGTRRVQASGEGDHADNSHTGNRFAIDDATVDLVIQNPPFTRPNGPEADKLGVPIPSFAGFDTGTDEQKAMALRLRELSSGADGRAGRGNAGLASNFLDLAHAKIRPGGVLALVVPATFSSGHAWSASRDLLAREYRDITVVTLGASSGDDRAFSADTGMAEALVVATKREAGGESACGDGDKIDQSTAWVDWMSLWRRPENPVEAVTSARAISAASASSATDTADIGSFEFLKVGGILGHEIGCRISAPLSEGGCAHITQPLLAAAAIGLRSGRLRLPRTGIISLPTARLGALGRAGPQNRVFDDKRLRLDAVGNPQRDEEGHLIRNGVFDVAHEIEVEADCEFPALWGHDVASGRERCLVVAPDRDLRPWPGHRERARALWKTATRLHFNRDFRLNSQSLSACITPKRCLGGVAWPSFVLHQSDFEAALAVWANTSLGLIGHWWVGTKQQAGRARLSIQTLPDVPALDCRKLTDEQIEALSRVFTEFADRPFRAANEALRDETRQELDEAVMCDVLELDKAADVSRREFLEALSVLRSQWCAEPSVHGGKATAPLRRMLLRATRISARLEYVACQTTAQP